MDLMERKKFKIDLLVEIAELKMELKQTLEEVDSFLDSIQKQGNFQTIDIDTFLEAL